MLKEHSFKLEPIYNSQKRMIACELLTVMGNENESVIGFIKSLNGSQRSTFLYNQLSTLLGMSDFILKRKILISINFDYQLAVTLLRSPFLMSLINEMNFIRIEVSENFMGLQDFKNNKILHELSQQFTLWLDDFGSGESNLNVALSGYFECIKLDRDFFWNYSTKIIFPVILDNMIKHMGKIIIEGVETPEHLNLLKDYDYYGAQGYIYPSLQVMKFGEVLYDGFKNNLELI